MNSEQQFRLESNLITALTGKLTLFQTQSERKEIIKQALEGILKQPEYKQEAKDLGTTESKQNFIDKFLSYDVCTNLINDIEVEDIVINNLKPIHIHHTQKGFIKTEHKFQSQSEVDLFVK